MPFPAKLQFFYAETVKNQVGELAQQLVVLIWTLTTLVAWDRDTHTEPVPGYNVRLTLTMRVVLA